jgi:drug/metabolite transporter (DMT)-like permease
MIDGRHRGWALAAFGMLMVSTDSFFIRQADFDSWTIAFVFGTTSAIALAIVWRARATEPASASLRRAPLPLLGAAALSAATQICFTAAVNHTAVSNVVVIVAATPIFAAVLAWIVLRERTDRRVLIAIAFVIVGVATVVSGSLGTPTLDGDLLALAAILMFSLSVIVWRRHPEIDRPLVLATSSATMALITAPFASVGDAPLRLFVAVGLMGFIFNPIGRISYTSAPKYAPAAEVALFTPVETVAATTWAWIFFSERPSTQTVIGGAIVLAAVLYGTVGSRHQALRGKRATPGTAVTPPTV